MCPLPLQLLNTVCISKVLSLSDKIILTFEPNLAQVNLKVTFPVPNDFQSEK